MTDEMDDGAEDIEGEEDDGNAEGDHLEEEEHHEVLNEHRKRKESEVFVGGLDKDATEDDLRKAFSEVGDVTEVQLMMNPHPRPASWGAGPAGCFKPGQREYSISSPAASWPSRRGRRRSRLSQTTPTARRARPPRGTPLAPRAPLRLLLLLLLLLLLVTLKETKRAREKESGSV